MKTEQDDADEHDDDFGDEVIDVTNFAVDVDEPFAALEATFEDDDEDTLVENRPAMLMSSAR